MRNDNDNIICTSILFVSPAHPFRQHAPPSDPYPPALDHNSTGAVQRAPPTPRRRLDALRDVLGKATTTKTATTTVRWQPRALIIITIIIL